MGLKLKRNGELEGCPQWSDWSVLEERWNWGRFQFWRFLLFTCFSCLSIYLMWFLLLKNL